MNLKLDPTQAELIASKLDVQAAEFEMNLDELRGVNGGTSIITTMAIGEEDGGWATTLAIGEEDGCVARPIIELPKKPPVFTTLAVGEEDGLYIS